MIYGIENKGTPGYLQEYGVSTGSAFALGFEDAVADNPFTKLITYGGTKLATGKDLSLEQAKERARESGVEVRNLPQDGIKEDALDILIERQYRKKVRQEALSTIPDGFGKTVLEFSGGIAGSFLDPLNIASAFIPVVGQARYAVWLKGASSAAGRLKVRAGVGAVEGAAGAVALEPLNYGLAQEIGDDYTSVNSLMNIAFGTVLGAGLHMGVGIAGEVGRSGGGDFRSNGPTGKGAKRLADMSPEARMDIARTSLAQALDDKPINVAAVMEHHELNLKAQKNEISKKLLDAQNANDIPAIEDHSSQIRRIEKQLGEAAPQEPRAIDAKTLKEQYTTSEGKLDVERATKSTIADVEKAIDAGAEVRLKVGNKDVEIKRVKDGALIDAEGKSHSIKETIFSKEEGRIEINMEPGRGPHIQEGQALVESTLDGQRINSIKNKQQNLKKIAENSKSTGDTRFLDKETTQRHDTQLAEEVSDVTVEDAQVKLKEAIDELKEVAEQKGIDPKTLTRQADALVKKSEEYVKALRTFGVCALRGG